MVGTGGLAFQIVKWSLESGESARWEYDVEDWGGSAPVIIFENNVQFTSKLHANLISSDNAYLISYEESNNFCDKTKNHSARATYTALIIRQGLMQIDDVVIWAYIGQFPTSASIEPQYSADQKAVFSQSEWPILQVYSSVYASNVDLENIIRSDSKLSFSLTSSATVGLAVIGVAGGTDAATLAIGTHTLSLGAIGGSDLDADTSKIAVEFQDSPGCLQPAIFLSTVTNSNATTRGQAKLEAMSVEQLSNYTLTLGFFTEPKTCSKGSIGNVPDDVIHAMGVLTSTSCFSLSQDWYKPIDSGKSQPSSPGHSAKGTVILVFLLLGLVAGLVVVGFYGWRRYRRISQIADEGPQDQSRLSNPTGSDLQISTPNRLELASNDPNMRNSTTATPTIRIQPTGALRPPKFLTAG